MIIVIIKTKCWHRGHLFDCFTLPNSFYFFLIHLCKKDQVWAYFQQTASFVSNEE